MTQQHCANCSPSSGFPDWDRAGPAANPTPSEATRPTRPGRTAPTCAHAGSPPSSPSHQTRSAIARTKAHAAGDRWPSSAHDYKNRNVVERAFNHLKNWRGLATRYDKYALVYRGGVVLAAILLWLS